MTKEIEVKIRLTTEEARRLEGLFSGCPKVFQRTYGYFTPDNKSIERGIFPRIREEENLTTKERKTELTVKVKKGENKKLFERDEYTIAISDSKEADMILKALGFTKVIVFEKNRTTKSIGRALVCLDELPFGHFLEIEAAPEEIDKIAKDLGFEQKEKVNRAYLGLWEDYRRESAIEESDCRF
jgi:adenylate cyclase class 2